MQAWLDHALSSLSNLPLMLQFLTISTASGLTEEVAALGVLALARSGHVAWWLAISAMVTGTTVANMVVWWMGSAAGEKALKWRLFSGIGGRRMEKIRSQVQAKGWAAVMAARLIPGTRIGVFLLAGILGMNGWTFFLTLAIGTGIWVLSLLGLIQVMGGLAHQHPFLAGLLLVVVVFAGILLGRSRTKALDAPT